MADNFLEKRYEEIFGKNASGSHSSVHRPGLDTLLLRNRSYRGFRNDYQVHPLQLKAILGVNCKIASGRNAQLLRFHTVTTEAEVAATLALIHLGGALPELHLPFPGTEPGCFIVVCGKSAETPTLDIDLGISLQSMLLKAVELGLGGIIVRNFNRNELQKALGLPLEPLAVLALGKPAEKIELVDVREGADLNYYRKDGIHYVPKIVLEDLMV